MQYYKPVNNYFEGVVFSSDGNLMYIVSLRVTQIVLVSQLPMAGSEASFATVSKIKVYIKFPS